MTKSNKDAPEHIICAAIWVDTGKAWPPRRSCAYPETGLVFGAWRHGDCFTIVHAWYEQLSWWNRWKVIRRYNVIPWWRFWRKPWCPFVLGVIGKHQGFITSKGRFVLRDEGEIVAKEAGQIDRIIGGCLTSEDLY